MNLIRSAIERLNRTFGFQEREVQSFKLLPVTESRGVPRSADERENIQYPAIHQTVYACIDVISAKASEVPLVAVRHREILERSLTLDLLESPNHVHTRVDLFRQTFQHLLADGNAYWEIVYDDPVVPASAYAQELGMTTEHAALLLGGTHVRLSQAYDRVCRFYGAGAISDDAMVRLLDIHSRVRQKHARPVALWPIVPTRVKIVPDPQRFIAGYIFEHLGKRVPVGFDEVIHFKLPHPSNDYYGLSPLSAARLAISTDLQAQEYQRMFFENSAAPGGILSPSFPIDPEAIKKLREDWVKAHKGAAMAHRLAILPYGLQYQPISISQADAQFIETMRLSRDQIREIYRVDDFMLGRANTMTQNGAIEARASFYQDVVMPLLLLVEQKINKMLVPKLEKDVHIRFDPWRMAAMLPVLRLREEVARLRIANAWPVNLVFETLHGIKSPIQSDAGNLAHIPANLLPLGVVSQSVAGPEPKTFSLKDHLRRALQLAEAEYHDASTNGLEQTVES